MQFPARTALGALSKISAAPLSSACLMRRLSLVFASPGARSVNNANARRLSRNVSMPYRETMISSAAAAVVSFFAMIQLLSSV